MPPDLRRRPQRREAPRPAPDGSRCLGGAPIFGPEVAHLTGHGPLLEVFAYGQLDEQPRPITAHPETKPAVVIADHLARDCQPVAS
jgi:hypothetical protein